MFFSRSVSPTVRPEHQRLVTRSVGSITCQICPQVTPSDHRSSLLPLTQRQHQPGRYVRHLLGGHTSYRSRPFSGQAAPASHIGCSSPSNHTSALLASDEHNGGGAGPGVSGGIGVGGWGSGHGNRKGGSGGGGGSGGSDGGDVGGNGGSDPRRSPSTLSALPLPFHLAGLAVVVAAAAWGLLGHAPPAAAATAAAPPSPDGPLSSAPAAAPPSQPVRRFPPTWRTAAAAAEASASAAAPSGTSPSSSSSFSPVSTPPDPATTTTTGQYANGDSTAAPPQPAVHDPETVNRLKRLLREVFSDVTELRGRLDAADAAAAEAAAAAGEAWVIPLEGLSVRPYGRRLAADMRLRSRAQVSGTVDTSVVAPLAASERLPYSYDDDDDVFLPLPSLPYHHPAVSTSTAIAASASKPPAATTTITLSPPPAAPGCPPGSSPCHLAAMPSLDWDGMVREAGMRPAAGAPRIRLRIQSLWGAGSPFDGETHQPGSGALPAPAPAGAPVLRKEGRDAGGNATSLQGDGGGGGGGGGQQRRLEGAAGSAGVDSEAAGEERPVAAHLQLETGPDGRSVLVDRLLLKAEAHPRIRLLLAARGSLDNIGTNVNPFAGPGELQRGLTSASRRGHDLALLGEGGAGAAAAVRTGHLGAALGAFVAGPSSALMGSGNPSTSAVAPDASAATITCGQISVHRSRRFMLTAAGSVTAPTPGTSSAAGTHATGLPAAETTGPAGGGAGGGGAGGGEARRAVQRGLIGAILLGDRLSAAAWIGDAVSRTHHHASPPSRLGPRGLRQRRLGVRLATLPDEDTGRSYTLSLSHRRWMAGDSRRSSAAGDADGPRSGGESAGVLLGEASASLPVAPGVVVTPGVVLLVAGRRSGAGAGGGGGGGVGGGDGRRTMLCTAVQTSWHF